MCGGLRRGAAVRGTAKPGRWRRVGGSLLCARPCAARQLRPAFGISSTGRPGPASHLSLETATRIRPVQVTAGAVLKALHGRPTRTGAHLFSAPLDVSPDPPTCRGLRVGRSAEKEGGARCDSFVCIVGVLFLYVRARITVCVCARARAWWWWWWCVCGCVFARIFVRACMFVLAVVHVHVHALPSICLCL